MRVAVHLMLIGTPCRHGDHVAFRPPHFGVATTRRTAAFDNSEDCVGGGAVSWRNESRWHALHVDGRALQRWRAEFDLALRHAVCGCCRLVERRERRLPPERNRGLRNAHDVLLQPVRVALEEHRLEQVDERHVEYVYPEALVRACIRVRMPAPAGRQENVSRPHFNPHTVNNRVGALSFENDPQRVGCMAVRVGDLARFDRLVCADKRAYRRIQVPFHGVPECEVAAVCHAVIHQVAGTFENRFDVGVSPEHGQKVFARFAPQ